MGQWSSVAVFALHPKGLDFSYRILIFNECDHSHLPSAFGTYQRINPTYLLNQARPVFPNTPVGQFRFNDVANLIISPSYFPPVTVHVVKNQKSALFTRPFRAYSNIWPHAIRGHRTLAASIRLWTDISAHRPQYGKVGAPGKTRPAKSSGPIVPAMFHGGVRCEPRHKH